MYKGKPTLVCEADAYPPQIQYFWEARDKNETESFPVRGDFKVGSKSYLTPKKGISFDFIYQCMPNNTMGLGSCEYDAANGYEVLKLNYLLIVSSILWSLLVRGFSV